MTVSDFQKKIGVEEIRVETIDGHLYTISPCSLDINKNITMEDINAKANFEVLEFNGTYVLSKDGTLCPHGFPLDGNWKQGFALDLHTTKSALTGVNEFGYNVYSTQRPPIAEDLYQLKYRKDNERTGKIADQAAHFLGKSGWKIDLIIPIPPSDQTRPVQPVYELAKSVGEKTSISVDFATLKKIKSTSELKDINDKEKRREILKGAFDIESNSLQDKDVLLIDDLFRSGETLQAATDILLKKGKARNVYVLTITKTRSNR